MADLRCFWCVTAFICVGCDDWSDDTGVRAADVVLSDAKLEGISAQGSSELASVVSAEGCAGARTGLEQLADTTGGAMRYGGNAELIVEGALWSQVPVNLRGDLATAIALVDACESNANPRDVVVTIREPDGGPVLKRGKPASFVE